MRHAGPFHCVITTSTLQGACSIKALETELRHHCAVQLLLMLMAHHDQIGPAPMGTVGDLTHRIPDDHLAAHAQTGIGQLSHTSFKDGLVASFLVFLHRSGINDSLFPHRARENRYHGNQHQFGVASLGNFMAIEQGLLPRSRTVVCQQD